MLRERMGGAGSYSVRRPKLVVDRAVHYDRKKDDVSQDQAVWAATVIKIHLDSMRKGYKPHFPSEPHFNEEAKSD